MAVTMEIAATTDVGRVRELNEDSVWTHSFAPDEPNPWNLQAILLVADGMGGHQSGEIASALAAETARRLFTENEATDPSCDAPPAAELKKHVGDAVRTINRTVYAESAALGGEVQTRPGTTLTIALLRQGEYVVAHIGDSRAYLLRAGTGKCEQITADDSFVAEAVRRGQMSHEQARSSPMRNQITKAVGLDAEVEPAIYHSMWAHGDAILLCSDGLSEYVRDEEFARILAASADLESACRRLAELANERGGHDNISVLLARNAERPLGEGVSDDDTLTDIEIPESLAPLTRSVASDTEVVASRHNRRTRQNQTFLLKTVALVLVIAGGIAGVRFYGTQRVSEPSSNEHIRPLSSQRVPATAVTLHVLAEQTTPLGPALVVRADSAAYRARVKSGKNGNAVENRATASYIKIKAWKNFQAQISSRKALLKVDGEAAQKIEAHLDPAREYSLQYVMPNAGKTFELARIYFEPHTMRTKPLAKP